MKRDKGKEFRNELPFESRKKVSGRKSYGTSGANDAKRDSSFATRKDKKRSRRRLRDLVRVGLFWIMRLDSAQQKPGQKHLDSISLSRAFK